MFGRDSSDGTRDAETLAQARERMVERLVDADRIERPTTVDALRAVPRHEFVPESKREAAYADRPLPIEEGQTISAPHMVGIICELLELEGGDSVLEIGTGCGYHAAVTAEVVGAENVHSVEYVPSLGADAEARLERLGYGDIHLRVGDGSEGWPEHAPYDAAYLTCAAPEIPEAIVEQLQVGGPVVAPIGTGRQTLVRAIRTSDGFERETHGGVRFVEMKGDAER